MSVALKAGFVAAVAGVFAGSVMLLRGGAAETGGNIRVLSRLDEYTRKSNPTIANTIPTFLMQLGRTGALPSTAAASPAATPSGTATSAPGAAPAAGGQPPSGAKPPLTTSAPPSTAAGTAAPTAATPAAGGNSTVEPASDAPIPVAAVKPVNEVELQKGFCTATLARLVRQQYPGTYESMPDAELEKSVLKQHPEYKGRLCILPVWIDADPHDIVKYEVVQDVASIPQMVWLWSGLIAAGFAVVVLVVYKKATAEPPPPPASPQRTQKVPAQKKP